jgi:hypothetical protein
MSKLIDVSKLNQALVVYDRALRALPYSTLKEVAAALKINLMDLQGKHSLINERRRAGGTQSYKIGKEFVKVEKLLGYVPSEIEPKDVVFITKENSQKYDDLELLIVGGQPVSNITKRHPMELKIASMLVRSHVEDVVDMLFHAVRDDDSTSPSGAFNGFFSKLNDLLTLGELTAERGNYHETGAIQDPVDGSDTEAYEKVVEFIATSNPYLRKSSSGIPQLLISQGTLSAVRAAFRNKVKSFDYPSLQKVIESLREDAFCPGLVVSTHECIGKGSKLILQKVGNMDLAFNTQAATKFCQVRDIYEDPNEWQFWLQSGYDTRIRDWHEKVFRTNEQQNTPWELAGDYVHESGGSGSGAQGGGSGSSAQGGDSGSSAQGGGSGSSAQGGDSGSSAQGGDSQAATPTYVYTPVDDTAGKNPSTEGWYERSGESEPYTYELTDDTEPGQDVTYYIRTEQAGT